MSAVLYRLRLRGALHLGTGRADDLADLDELPRSDTIAAALLSLWRNASTVPVDLASVAERPPFAVSSAMALVESAPGRWDPLLPLPAGLLERLGRRGSSSKSLRRARFAMTSVLRDLLAGRVPEVLTVNGCLLVTGLQATYGNGLWRTESRLRLAVNRLGDGPIPGALYEFGAVRFAPNVRLGIVGSFMDEQARSCFERALTLLADEGIGADRSVGYGRFDLESADAFNVQFGKGMRLSLSLLHPSQAEVEGGLLDPPASYDTVVRGGSVTSPGARMLRKKTVRMLAEGAVVQDLGSEHVGDSPLVLEPWPDVGLGHPVFRPGVAVTVPVEWKD